MTHDTDNLDTALAEIEATRNARRRKAPTVVESMTKALERAYRHAEQVHTRSLPIEVKSYPCE